MLKSNVGAATTRVIMLVRVNPAPRPVIVIAYVPTGVVGEVIIFISDWNDGRPLCWLRS